MNPKSWTTRRRWSSHSDMIIQYLQEFFVLNNHIILSYIYILNQRYANCIEKKLYTANYTDIELYFDVWRSMNHRFNQRQLDPRKFNIL